MIENDKGNKKTKQEKRQKKELKLPCPKQDLTAEFIKETQPSKRVKEQPITENPDAKSAV